MNVRYYQAEELMELWVGIMTYRYQKLRLTVQECRSVVRFEFPENRLQLMLNPSADTVDMGKEEPMRPWELRLKFNGGRDIVGQLFPTGGWIESKNDWIAHLNDVLESRLRIRRDEGQGIVEVIG